MTSRLTPACPVVAAALACAVCAVADAQGTTVAPQKSYNLPGGDAATTLRRFAADSGEQIVYLVENVRGQRTNEVIGKYSAREALDRMLAGTALVATQDPATGAMVVGRRRSAQPAEPAGREKSASQIQPSPVKKPNLLTRSAALFAALVAPLADAQVAPASNAPSNQEETTVTLSPFEVSASNQGYYSANTMSGTRLNSSIEDLPMSLTVVTKDQMADFAMLDINDIFMYEAGTEGSGTFTEFSIDRNGSPVDLTSTNPNSANRMRGVGSANIAFGNFETTGSVPVDPINIDAVEISRGPNSSVFGLGNAAGTVNMVPASANLRRNRATTSFRVDSYGGYRTSLDVNRVLKDGKLAVRGSAVYQHEGFVRKPSGIDSVRLNGMLRFQPFRNTSFTASHSYYHMEGTRTNAVMPRDAISGWVAAGSPSWDPRTGTATITTGPNAGQSTTYTGTSLPFYFGNSNSRPLSTIHIEGLDGSILHWSPTRLTTSTNPNAAVTQSLVGNQHRALVLTVPDPIREQQPLFAGNPTVSSRDVYDYLSVNLAGMNSYEEHNQTTHLQLEQFFLNTPRQVLALQAAHFLEYSSRYFRELAGRAGSNGATGMLHVDPNTHLLDGTPNPNYGRPFLGYWNVRSTQYIPVRRATTRAQLAYRLDLREETSALRWLGMHQLSGYGEYKLHRERRSQYEDRIESEHSWRTRPATVQQSSNWTVPDVTRLYYQYYIGDPGDYTVKYGPRDLQYGLHPFTWGNGVTDDFITEQADLVQGYEWGATIGWRKLVTKTKGGVLQSHLFNNRVVTTFGYRKDETFNRNHRGAAKVIYYGPDGYELDESSLWELDDASLQIRQGATKTAGLVVKPTRWLNLHYNVSDSFKPENIVAQDLFLNYIPNPTGEGEDYGFSLNLLGGKLMMRVNKYSTMQYNSRNGSARTLAQRARGFDIEQSTNSPNALVARARGWVTRAAIAEGVTLTEDQINQRISTITQLDEEYFTRDDGSLSQQNNWVFETDDLESKGIEFELNYNPTNYWTLKFNVTKTEAINSNLSPGVQNWIDLRLPVWQTIIDPELGVPWWTERYGESTSASQRFQTNVVAPLAIEVAMDGKSRPQIRKYRANLSTSFRLAGITDHNQLKRMTVGGALRWEDKGAIGYYGVESLPDVITALDPTRPIYDKDRLYADMFVAYRTRLFDDKVAATFQLNVRNIQESGSLRPISAWPDGRPNGYRIVDPRLFILTATFDF